MNKWKLLHYTSWRSNIFNDFCCENEQREMKMPLTMSWNRLVCRQLFRIKIMKSDCKNTISGSDNKCTVCTWIELTLYFQTGDIFYTKTNDCDLIFYPPVQFQNVNKYVNNISQPTFKKIFWTWSSPTEIHSKVLTLAVVYNRTVCL